MADFEHKVLQTLKKHQSKTRQEEGWGMPENNPVALNYVNYLMSMTERQT